MANIVQCGATLKKVLAKPSHFQFQDVPVGEHLPVTPNGSLKAKSHPPNVLERVRFSHILFLPHSAMPNGFAKPGDCRLICGMLSLMTIAPVTHVLFGVRSLGLLVLPLFCWMVGNFFVSNSRSPSSPSADSTNSPVCHCHFETFVIAFRAFEAELCKASRLYARQKRETNPNAIFQDLRSFQANGVDVLLKPVSAEIIELRADDCSIVLARPIVLDPDLPVLCEGHAIPVIHAEADVVWVENFDQVAVGRSVLHLKTSGTTPKLFQLFLGAWQKMWGRHSDVSPDRWNTILAFARQHLPRKVVSWPEFDETALTQCIASKKRTTSAGLDGVTLEDLKAPPGPALHNFLAMYRQAECTGEWPSQVVAGRVTCLPKKPDPGDAMDFRPITVLGLLYRC